MNFGVTSDFSRVASRYDATREVPETHLAACYERLVRQGLLPTKGVVLDAGCGTGQISLVLAKMGYEVHGIDVSAEMVAIAQGKCRPEWQAALLANCNGRRSWSVQDGYCVPATPDGRPDGFRVGDNRTLFKDGT